MAFALLKPKAIDVSDLPLFDFQKFFNKEEIGKGGFGAVFTADYYPHGSSFPPFPSDFEGGLRFLHTGGIV